MTFTIPAMFGDGATQRAADIQAVFDEAGAAGGGEVYWPRGVYLMDARINLAAGTHDNITVNVEPGTRIVAVGSGLLRVSARGVKVISHGARWEGAASTSSSTIYLADAADFAWEGGEVDGAYKDCFYLGSDLTDGYSRRVHISGVRVRNAGRNCISAVAVKDWEISRCDIAGAVGSPGCGIDVEANRYDTCARGSVHHCEIHGNANFGMLVAFATDIEEHHNHFHDNGNAGFAVSSAAAQFDAGVFRPGIDVRAISGFDQSTGEISISHGHGLEVGTLVFFREEGGTKPAEFTAQTRWFVASKSADNQRIRLSRDAVTEVTSIASLDGVGTLTNDPLTSSLLLRCYEEGQASHIRSHDSVYEGNGGFKEIELAAGAVDVELRGHRIVAGPDRAAIWASYSRNLHITGNRGRGHGATLSTNTSYSKGVHLGMCSGVTAGMVAADNDMRHFLAPVSASAVL